MTLELIKGAALLLSLCLLQSFNVRLWQRRQWIQEVAGGLIFGGICIVGMMLPLRLAPGVIFDARSVIMCMAGLFGGPVAGAIAAVIAGGYRIHLGGGGAPVGVAVVVCSLMFGLAYRYARQKGRLGVDFLPLLGLGFVVHVANVGLFTQLPAAVVPEVMHRLAAPYVLIFTLATGLLGLLLRDIERRTDMEQTLRDHEREQSEILNNSPAVIYLKDTRGRFLFVNRQFEKMSGISNEDMRGTTDYDHLPREIADCLSASERKVIESGQALEIEEEVPGPGNGRTYLANKFPLRNRNGEIYAVCTIATDITDRTETENERVEALREAQQANQAKSTFLAAMSHEFRTPLNAIMGFSEMLKEPLPDSLDQARVRDYAGSIHDAGAHMLTLVDDILDTAAIEAGHRILNKEPVDSIALARSCMRSVEPAARARGIAVSLDADEGLAPISADRRALTQILLNLLSNAIKFTKAGGRVVVAIRTATDRSLITVTDTGVGIAAENLHSVTEPFSRTHTDPHVAQEGSGLGLSIVKSLVEAHGGSMRIESEVGVGTAVSIELPLDATA